MIYRAVVVIIIYDKIEKIAFHVQVQSLVTASLSDAVTEGFCADARFRNQKY